VVLLLSFVSALFGTALLVRYGRGHTLRCAAEVPQRFHLGQVPRLGGLAMWAASTLGWCWMALSQHLDFASNLRSDAAMAGSLWTVASITVAAAIVAVWLLDLTVPRLGLPGIDSWWSLSPWFGVALAVLGVGGLPHALNLIDGYNGLAGTVALVCCLALAYVALQVGDRQLAAAVLVLAGATAGFLVWNYPRGLIFAGDGGAYLWGVVIAIASILLVLRHPQVSPWFPLLLLIYRRIVRQVFDDDEARRMLMRNNRTSPYLWGLAFLSVLPAVLFWNQTPLLMLFIVVFIVSYVWAYTSIVRFKVPRWLRR
jgi:UDP-GlcNAc:undecaprenyl-phosphate GlcNAc-1-phosphate transferase